MSSTGVPSMASSFGNRQAFAFDPHQFANRAANAVGRFLPRCAKIPTLGQSGLLRRRAPLTIFCGATSWNKYRISTCEKAASPCRGLGAERGIQFNDGLFAAPEVVFGGFCAGRGQAPMGSTVKFMMGRFR